VAIGLGAGRQFDVVFEFLHRTPQESAGNVSSPWQRTAILNGKTADCALRREMGTFLDSWQTGTGREIRLFGLYDAHMKRPRGRPKHADLLTPSEWRTVYAVQHGMTNQEIARRRGVSVNAVKFHVANALAKLGLADRKALRAWFRAPRDGANDTRRTTMTSLQLGPIGQIARSVSDTAASEKWYRDMLGLPHLYTFGTLAFFDCGGTRLMLSQREGGAAAESILYLRVADIGAAHDALKQRGVKFTHAPHMIHRHADGTEEWMAFFEDPDARPLALMSQRKMGSAPVS
jgi:DNA-binding CsgD family transcriptional regulator/catechol 2,3-dioxygenase-like lactoylglutathione lyase family enzyme